MADSRRKSVHDQFQDEGPSKAESRRFFKISIQRLERIIAVQEDRIKKMRYQTMGTPRETRRVRDAMKDLLCIARLTLQQLKASADNLELSWAMLE